MCSPTTANVPTPSALRWACLLLFIAWGLHALAALAAGPLLGDHEVIVAQTARQTLTSGEWLVPYYLDIPFLVKAPLAAWLAAALGAVLPNDGATGLPVSDFAARLPSVLATGLTIWIVFVLGRTMFKPRTGLIAAFVYATTIGSMLYAFNATAEALLTFFCAWAFAEFWWSRQANTKRRRFVHQIRFYAALGLGMLAKGPMPLLSVALPIAVWWWCDRPTRLAAAGGLSAIPQALRLGVCKILPALKRALTQLGLWWGVPLFLLLFLPWMIGVAQRQPYAWSLWSYEYLDRVKGDYPGSAAGHHLYYLPILFGLLFPWCLSLPEALISPFRRRHRYEGRKPLTYVWYWVVVGFVVLSFMSFKKPYYILPLLPGCVLLLAPVLERLFFEAPPQQRRVRIAVSIIFVGMLTSLIAGGFIIENKYPGTLQGIATWGIILSCGIAVAGVALACVLFGIGRRKLSFCLIGGNSLLIFTLVWCLLGPSLGNANEAAELAHQANLAGIPADTPLYWVSNRPDGRAFYYGGRPILHAIDFYHLIATAKNSAAREDLQFTAAGRICSLLDTPDPVYAVFQRGQLEMLMSFFRLHARELFSVDRPPAGQDSHDWIVVTNVDVHNDT